MSRFAPPEHERGAALLAVLLLVAITGAMAAGAVDKLRLSQRLAANSAGLEQARSFSTGLESLALLTIEDMLARNHERTTLAGGWNGAARIVPLPGGASGRIGIRDGGNCFNLNSLVQGGADTPLVARPLGIAQFTALMGHVGIPEPQARRIAASAADWADDDAAPLPEGAEDGDYARDRYRTGNSLFAEPSELRAVAGVSAEAYGRVRPWLCALPLAELSPINVNTLAPEQAPLLAMLAPGQLSVARAESVLRSRPAAGWANSVELWRVEALSELDLPLDAQIQAQVRTQWFALDIVTHVDGAEAVETALVDARRQPARIAIRRWGADE